MPEVRFSGTASRAGLLCTTVLVIRSQTIGLLSLAVGEVSPVFLHLTCITSYISAGFFFSRLNRTVSERHTHTHKNPSQGVGA